MCQNSIPFSAEPYSIICTWPRSRKYPAMWFEKQRHLCLDFFQTALINHVLLVHFSADGLFVGFYGSVLRRSQSGSNLLFHLISTVCMCVKPKQNFHCFLNMPVLSHLHTPNFRLSEKPPDPPFLLNSPKLCLSLNAIRPRHHFWSPFPSVPRRALALFLHQHVIQGPPSVLQVFLLTKLGKLAKSH